MLKLIVAVQIQAERIGRNVTTGGARAALAASIFHYGTYTIAETKRFLADRGVVVRTDGLAA